MDRSSEHIRRQPNAPPDADTRVPAWVDRISEVVFRCDGTGRIFFVNTSWTRTLEFSPDETLGRNINDFVHDQDRDVHRVRFQTLLDGRRLSLQHEVRFVARDGSVRWLELRVVSERGDDDGVAGLTGTLTDVTPRRRMADELRTLAQEAEEARADAESAAQLLRATADDLARERDQAVASSRAVTEFIASMAQDLRTPMNGVLGMTEILLHGELKPEQRQQALTVRDSAESLVRLVDDIVSFSSSADAVGDLATDDADFDLRAVVEDVRLLLVQKALAKGIPFVTTVAPNVPDHLLGDAARLRQLVMNLASNAIRVTDEGEVSVMVTRAPRPNADGGVPIRIEVHDGSPRAASPTLSPAAAPRAVDRADDAAPAGLGMAVSRRLVESMGGRIDSGGEAGEGSWIAVELPLQRASDGAPARSQGLNFDGAPLRIRVLVAEDNLVNQKVATRILERWGVQVKVVGDGMSAIDATDRESFDAVLMDVRMPRLDGLQASEEIRSREAVSKRARVPIVAMTANSGESDRQRCFEAGMDGFVAKPLQPEVLYAELSRWSRGSAAGEQARAA